jgi:DNA mismatch repair protein PMS2
LKDYGFNGIEVTDDGEGMTEAEIECIGSSYHTSKLRAFEDLERTTYFGFRGEALASLITMSHVSIISKSKSSSNIQEQSPAVTINFDRNGKVQSREFSVRKVNTFEIKRIIITSLFFFTKGWYYSQGQGFILYNACTSEGNGKTLQKGIFQNHNYVTRICTNTK